MCIIRSKNRKPDVTENVRGVKSIIPAQIKQDEKKTQFNSSNMCGL
jgi:hypothetical protein